MMRNPICVGKVESPDYGVSVSTRSGHSALATSCPSGAGRRRPRGRRERPARGKNVLSSTSGTKSCAPSGIDRRLPIYECANYRASERTAHLSPTPSASSLSVLMKDGEPHRNRTCHDARPTGSSQRRSRPATHCSRASIGHDSACLWREPLRRTRQLPARDEAGRAGSLQIRDAHKRPGSKARL